MVSVMTGNLCDEYHPITTGWSMCWALDPDVSFIVSYPPPSDTEVSRLWSISIALSGASKVWLTVPGWSLRATSLLIAVSLRCVLRQCNVVELLGREWESRSERCEAKKKQTEEIKARLAKVRRRDSGSVFWRKKKRVKKLQSPGQKKSLPMPPLGSSSVVIHPAAFFSMFNDGRTNQ